jgi:hypothetical protein
MPKVQRYTVSSQPLSDQAHFGLRLRESFHFGSEDQTSLAVFVNDRQSHDAGIEACTQLGQTWR